MDKKKHDAAQFRNCSSAALPLRHRPFRPACGRPRPSGSLGAGSIGAGSAVACYIAVAPLRRCGLPPKPTHQKPTDFLYNLSRSLVYGVA